MYYRNNLKIPPILGKNIKKLNKKSMQLIKVSVPLHILTSHLKSILINIYAGNVSLYIGMTSDKELLPSWQRLYSLLGGH